MLESLGIIDWNPNIWHLVLRLVIAGVSGFVIGLERRARAKGAGIRTHTLLCCAAALFMIISKYGFHELAGMPGVNVDVTRVASNIITGLSFLGAGMLFYKRDSLKSLTTAVGVCFTVAIGMAYGAGMLIMGIVGTILVVVIQLFLHLNVKLFKSKHTTEIRVQFVVDDEYIEEFKKKYSVDHFHKFRTNRYDNELIADVTFYTHVRITSEELFAKMSKDEKIKYFEKLEEY